MEQRPNPDTLLQGIAEEEEKEKGGYGRLKIFFGYAAGVGKTYAMLSAAHAALEEGRDVVVGYVEPHTRPATLALLEGLEQLPPRQLQYRGITLREFDIDAALKRKPQIILVDELAHTNAEGSRHTKRYSDVEELLRAGIDVYTTVNVQHLESLNDIVASITHVVVRERIPDRIFDQADQVKLVDIEPDELIERLSEGKIYRENQARRALGNFFTRENLTALREIALRRTADRVTKEAERRKALNTGGDVYSGEHVLTCISSSPSNGKVLRTAARMAEAFRAAFTALYVESSGEQTEENNKQLLENIKLAKLLGAKVVTVYGDDIAGQISEYAKISGITKIVIGRSNNKKRLFGSGPNFVEQLANLSPGLDVHIIPDNLPPYEVKWKLIRKKQQIYFIDFLKLILIMGVCVAAGVLFESIGLKESNIVTIFIMGVLIISLITRSKLFDVLASVVAVLAFNYWFTNPKMTLHVYDPGYFVTFFVMLSASFIISTLMVKVRSQARQSARKAYRTEVLLETSQKLQQAGDMKAIIEEMAEQLIQLLGRTVIVYEGEGGKLLDPIVFPCKEDTEQDMTIYTSNDEQAVAAWAFKNKKNAGVSTDTLPGAKAYYLTVRSNDTAFAVVGIPMTEKDSPETFEKSLMIAIVNEVAFAMEKFKLTQAKKEITIKAERESLRANLLRAISHDLRTPLTSISGNANILIEGSGRLDEAMKQQMYENIYDDSLWLINLVENLLSITRIDSGAVNLNLQPELIDDIIKEALEHVDRRRGERDITVREQDECLMVRVDARLMVQVIINLVDNAIKYTPEGTPIQVAVMKRNQEVILEVRDSGPGIRDADKERIFEMFYTADNTRGDSKRSMGLGLFLCKSIIDIHGGRIFVKDNIPGGTVFGFTLPCKEVS